GLLLGIRVKDAAPVPHDHNLHRLDRRRLLQLGALATAGAAVAGLAGCAPTSTKAQPTESTPFTIGYVPIACSAPMAIADALGLFEKHGANDGFKQVYGWEDL